MTIHLGSFHLTQVLSFMNEFYGVTYKYLRVFPVDLY